MDIFKTHPGMADNAVFLRVRRMAMSSTVRPRPDWSWASSRSMSHMRMRFLPGSSRAQTSLQTRP